MSLSIVPGECAVSLDPRDPAFRADPYPTYRALRLQPGVHGLRPLPVAFG